jgi:hypothetical protein
LGRPGPVEVREAGGAEGEDSRAGAVGVGDEGVDVDALADWPEPLEEADGSLELGDSTAKITTLKVKETNADEQDPLIEVADVIILGPPEDLDGLVLLEILATIELVDSGAEQLGRRFGATIGVKGSVS